MNKPGARIRVGRRQRRRSLEQAQAQTLQILVGAGIKTREEARADLARAPPGTG